MNITDIIARLKSRLPIWHHVNYGINTIQSFDKDALVLSIASIQIEGIRCSEIRQSLNGYYFIQLVSI